MMHLSGFTKTQQIIVFIEFGMECLLFIFFVTVNFEMIFVAFETDLFSMVVYRFETKYDDSAD